MKRILLSLVILVSATAIAKQVVHTSSEGSVKLSIDVPSAISTSGSMIDVLFVIDDSGSMETHQTQVANRLPLLIGKMAQMGVDFHVGVLTSSVGSTSGEVPGNGVLVNRFVSSQEPDFVKRVERNMKVGTQGDGLEKFFAPLKLAMTEPNLSGPNVGFLRVTAPLAVIFITDGEDGGQETPEEMVKFLADLKGAVGFKTMAGFIPSVDTQCNRSGEMPPARLESFLAATSGSIANLCDTNMNDILAQSIASMIQPNPNPAPVPSPTIDRVIELPSKAVLSSIKVTYEGQLILFGDAYAGWVFDSNKNAILIGEGVPLGLKPWATKLEIEYQIANWP